MTPQERATKLVGRVFSRDGLVYTVTSASTYGEVCVWDPNKQGQEYTRRGNESRLSLATAEAR